MARRSMDGRACGCAVECGRCLAVLSGLCTLPSCSPNQIQYLIAAIAYLLPCHRGPIGRLLPSASSTSPSCVPWIAADPQANHTVIYDTAVSANTLQSSYFTHSALPSVHLAAVKRRRSRIWITVAICSSGPRKWRRHTCWPRRCIDSTLPALCRSARR